jgi:hypothetical protein
MSEEDLDLWYKGSIFPDEADNKAVTER